MRVTLHEVSKGHALPTTSLEFHSGAVRFAIAETEQRPSVLGLIASGRMRAATGTVTLDGSASGRALRRAIALVDAPDVSDPHADVSLLGVVSEELMFAGRAATPLHARRWLGDLGYGELASRAIGDVDPSARVRILCELAVLRSGTEGIVLVSPDRHGGSPDGWWRIAAEFADRGFAMLVIVGGSAAVALERMRELGAINASGPIEPLVLDRGDDEADAVASEEPVEVDAGAAEVGAADAVAADPVAAEPGAAEDVSTDRAEEEPEDSANSTAGEAGASTSSERRDMEPVDVDPDDNASADAASAPPRTDPRIDPPADPSGSAETHRSSDHHDDPQPMPEASDETDAPENGADR